MRRVNRTLRPIHNTFSWDPETSTWTFLMQAESKDGTRQFFAEDTVRRKEDTAPPEGSAPMSNHEQLRPIEYLVGGTWTASGDLPGVGRYTAERTYRWALDGNFIEQRHVMRFPNGEIETKGMIGWDSEKKTIVAWGFGSDGGVATSRADHATSTEIRFEGVRAGGFNAGPVRATNKKVSDDEFLEIAEAKKGEVWTPMFTFQFTRRSSP